MINYKIVDAKIEDIPTLIEMQHKLGEVDKTYDYRIAKDKKVEYFDKKALEKLIKSKFGKILLVKVKNQIIGCCYGEIIKQKASFAKFQNLGFMSILYIEKEYRNKSLGRKVFQGIVDWLLDNKIEDIRFSVYTDNKKGIKLYKKLGFVEYKLQMSYKGKSKDNN